MSRCEIGKIPASERIAIFHRAIPSGSGPFRVLGSPPAQNCTCSLSRGIVPDSALGAARISAHTPTSAGHPTAPRRRCGQRGESLLADTSPSGPPVSTRRRGGVSRTLVADLDGQVPATYTARPVAKARWAVATRSGSRHKAVTPASCALRTNSLNLGGSCRVPRNWASTQGPDR